MPIKTDLAAELQTADPEFRSVLSDYIKLAIKDALVERDTATWLNHKSTAQFLGFTAPSLIAKRRRHSEIDQMSADNGRIRPWRRADLAQWLREQGHGSRRLGSTPGTSFFDRELE